MKPTIKKPKDFLCGIMFCVVGALFLFFSTNYSMGTNRQIGPGVFPAVVSGLAVLLGLGLAARSFYGSVLSLEGFRLKPTLLILGGCLLFAVLINGAGMVISLIVTVLVGSLADPTLTLIERMILALILSIGSYFVFVYLIGLPIPLLGVWFN